MKNIRPTYYKEYDEIDHMWNIFVHDCDISDYDLFIAEVESQELASALVDLMNDVTMRCWSEK